MDNIESDTLMECIEILRAKVKKLEWRIRRLEVENGDYDEEGESLLNDDED